MKTTLYYFSGTGNSLWVTRQLAQELGDTTIISVVDALENITETDTDCVGIIFPVYCWGLSRIMKRFLKRITVRDSQYVFAICTMGSIPAGTLKQAADILAKRNITLSAGFTIQMPDNYIIMINPPRRAKRERFFKKAEDKITRISEIIRQRQSHKIEGNNALVNWLLGGIYKVSIPHFPTMDKSFNVTEACTHCGICEQICPTNDIQLVDGKPVWGGNCEQCLSCIQWCPTEAIQFKTWTKNRKRYHHPDITITDMMKR